MAVSGNMPGTYVEACKEIAALRQVVARVLTAYEQLALSPGELDRWEEQRAALTTAAKLIGMR
jgi:hypothetical protein